MNNGETTLLDLEAQMQDIGLAFMAKKLDEIYRSPNYLGMDKLDLVSEILAPEYQDRTTKRLNNRLKNARLIGTPCDISKCVESTARQYTPAGAPKLLSSLKFIEDGLNLCILGASDSGKTYLAKALGTVACEKYRVSYNRCDEFLTALVDLKQSDYPKYERKIRKVLNFHLLIIDDFLLNTVTDERQVKVLLEVLEKRIELSRSTIVCSQREPDKWQAMIMNDAVSADAINKRVTKHYTIMIKHKE